MNESLELKIKLRFPKILLEIVLLVELLFNVEGMEYETVCACRY
jgi:hypothetical protein